MIRLTQKRSLSSEPDKIEIFSNTALSISDFKVNDISIYPNPCSGILKLNTTIKNLHYQLINVQGRVLQKGVVNKNQLDFSNFINGI